MRLAVSLIALLAAAPAVSSAAWAEPGEVIVHSSRLSAYQGDSAFAAANLDRDALDGSSLDQSLKQETQAALFRRQSSLTANPTVQGIGLRAIGPSGAGRALVTLDGVPQNDPFGNWVIWAALPEDEITHAHVVKGAGGGAYGAGALTGVIDLSLEPPQPKAGFVAATAAEGGGSDARAGMTLGPVALYAAARTLQGDVPVRYGSGAADVATYGRDRALFAHTQFPLLGGDLAIMAGNYDSRRDTGLRGATATSSGDQAAISLTRQPDARAIGWRLQAWHRDSDLSNVSVSVATGRASTTIANNQVATPATGDGFNAALRRKLGGLEWEIGADGRRSDGESREFFRYISGSATRYRVSGGSETVSGLYAEGSRDFGGTLVSGAFRADIWKTEDGHRTESDTATGAQTLALTFQDRSGTVVSGRVGATHDFGGLTGRVAAYTGFRPPSLNELYRPFRVGNDVTDANAGLTPEQLSGAELGLRGGDAATFFFDADVFANRLDHPITNVTVATGPFTSPTAGVIPAGGTLRQRQNLGQIRAYGLEAHGRYALGRTWAFEGALTLTHARVARANPAVNGLRPAEAPDYSGSIGLEGHVARATVHADLVFEGETFDDDLNTLPLKASRNLSLRLDYPLMRQVTLTASVTNALDAAIPVTHAGDGTIGYDTGRRITVGLVWRR
ncbi:TonB-dependent receptor [Asticcacaulis solisilvae]|uniref:TonB-dependent receptor n=1 Tax=Asticcacaulis solisilvae TaxID=1217274 RepID=UPI003FD85FC9